MRAAHARARGMKDSMSFRDGVPMATQPTDSKYRSRNSAADELAVIAQRAQAFTNASGAAVALAEGSTDEIVCRARSGSSAPDVGTTLRTEGSFTGLCIQSGKELRCDDAETDTRVDTAAIRALGIRSMVVTPIKEENKVVGVLAVFASTAHAFTITHVAVLKTMADQIAGLLQKERRNKEESANLEPTGPVAMPKPPVAIAPAPAQPSGPMIVRSSGAAPAAVAAAPAPLRVASSPVPAPTAVVPTVIPKVEPIKAAVAAPVATEIALPTPLPRREELPKREEKREEVRPEHKTGEHAKISFGTLDSVAEQKSSGPGASKSIVLVGVLVALAGAGTWAYLSTRKPAPQVAQNAQPAAVAPNPAPVTSTADSAAASGATAVPTGSGVAAPPSTAQPASSAPANTKPTTPVDKPETSKADVKDSKKDAQKKNADAQTRPTPEAPAPVSLSNGPSRITASTQQSAQPDVTPITPNLTSVGGNSGSLSSLAKPANTATPAMIAQSELVPVQVLRRVSPVYPPVAKARRLSGIVQVRVKVGKDGRVSNPEFLSGSEIFRDAAFEAVKQWQFKAATLNGQPIEQQTDIKLNFHP